MNVSRVMGFSTEGASPGRSGQVWEHTPKQGSVPILYTLGATGAQVGIQMKQVGQNL